MTDEQKPIQACSDIEWLSRLTPEQYEITRRRKTERAFTGEYWNEKRSGIYCCVCCGQPLFDSETKFDSGTGWPSFWTPIGDNIRSAPDESIPNMPRTEIACRRCNAHLGHVFGDGPRPTGQRYCVNSAALKLEPKE